MTHIGITDQEVQVAIKCLNTPITDGELEELEGTRERSSSSWDLMSDLHASQTKRVMKQCTSRRIKPKRFLVASAPNSPLKLSAADDDLSYSGSLSVPSSPMSPQGNLVAVES